MRCRSIGYLMTRWIGIIKYEFSVRPLNSRPFYSWMSFLCALVAIRLLTSYYATSRTSRNDENFLCFDSKYSMCSRALSKLRQNSLNLFNFCAWNALVRDSAKYTPLLQAPSSNSPVSLISSHLISSHLISSHLISPRAPFGASHGQEAVGLSLATLTSHAIVDRTERTHLSLHPRC